MIDNRDVNPGQSYFVSQDNDTFRSRNATIRSRADNQEVSDSDSSESGKRKLSIREKCEKIIMNPYYNMALLMANASMTIYGIIMFSGKKSGIDWSFMIAV